jgi:hypothetical protein
MKKKYVSKKGQYTYFSCINRDNLTVLERTLFSSDVKQVVHNKEPDELFQLSRCPRTSSMVQLEEITINN